MPTRARTRSDRSKATHKKAVDRSSRQHVPSKRVADCSKSNSTATVDIQGGSHHAGKDKQRKLEVSSHSSDEIQQAHPTKKQKRTLHAKQENFRKDSRAINMCTIEDNVEIIGGQRNREGSESSAIDEENHPEVTSAQADEPATTASPIFLTQPDYENAEEEEDGPKAGESSNPRGITNFQTQIPKSISFSRKLLDEMTKTIARSVEEKLSKSKLMDLDRQNKEYINIIYYLMYILEQNEPVKAVEMKVRPIRFLLGSKNYRVLFNTFVLMEANKKIGGAASYGKDGQELEKIIEVSKFIRNLLYSRNKGGKRDEYVIGGEKPHNVIKARLTWFMLNILQTNPMFGVPSIFIGTSSRKIENPYWLKPGYVKKQMVTTFFLDKHNMQKETKELEENIVVQELLKNINDLHNNVFNRVRERVRSEMMVQFAFLFEQNMDVTIDLVEETGEEEIENRLDQIPEITVQSMSPKVREKTTEKLWKDAILRTTDQMTVRVTYDVKVYKDNDELNKSKKSADNEIEFQRKTLKRDCNLMNLALTFILKISGYHDINEFFCSAKYYMKMVYILARLFWFCLRNEICKNNQVETNFDVSIVDELSTFIRTIRPQQYSTRMKIIEQNVLKVTVHEYDILSSKKMNAVEAVDISKNDESGSNELLDDLDEDVALLCVAVDD